MKRFHLFRLGFRKHARLNNVMKFITSGQAKTCKRCG
jgi:hypothetical protein